MGIIAVWLFVAWIVAAIVSSLNVVLNDRSRVCWDSSVESRCSSICMGNRSTSVSMCNGSISVGMRNRSISVSMCNRSISVSMCKRSICVSMSGRNNMGIIVWLGWAVHWVTSGGRRWIMHFVAVLLLSVMVRISCIIVKSIAVLVDQRSLINMSVDLVNNGLFRFWRFNMSRSNRFLHRLWNSLD